MRECGIYRIVHSASGREYIGQSQDIYGRWQRHRRSLCAGTHHSRHLQRVWIKYGPDSFRFEILLLCAIADLTKAEQHYFDKRKPAFNGCPAAGTTRGRKFTDESRAKMSAAQIGRKLPEEVIAKRRGRKLSEKALSSRRGRKLSPEHISNIRAALVGRIVSDETRAKIAAANRLWKRSDELKAKLSIANLGKMRSEETKTKIASTLRGRCKTEETKAMMRAAWVKRKAVKHSLTLNERS